MAEGSDELQVESEGFDGGVVKSFLEHLEDLRWMLIKSAAAALLGMMFCLFNLPKLRAVLQWPLDRAAQRHIMLLPDSTNQMVRFELGGAHFPPMDLKTNHFGGLDLGTNPLVTIRLDPIVTNGQQLLTWQIIPTPADASESTSPKLIVLDPGELFVSTLHMAFFAGLILASPFVLFFLGQFLMPALKIKEKKYFLQAFAVGVILFFMGVSFAYFVIMPAALKFAQLYATWMGLEAPNWLFGPYVGFVAKFMLGMGLGFELPVVLLALVKIGLLDYEKLTRMRRYMIVINLVLGAILTTPEIFTQVFMAVALQLLFEASVWIAWYWEYKEKKAQKS